MKNREFLMLAQTFDASKHRVAGWYMSEKLDGQRAFWDGGVSRNLDTELVPWSNVDKKVRPISTGLWSRYGNVIQAPDWFLDLLPDFPLDGELYMGRGNMQELRSIISRDIPDDRWKLVSYHAFDAPCLGGLFETGKINNPNMQKEISANTCQDFWARNGGKNHGTMQPRQVYTFLKDHEYGFLAHPQELLPSSEDAAVARVMDELHRICDLGGEGLMLRHPTSYWNAHRTKYLLKVKKLFDSEAVVKDHSPGVGKHEGRLGALVVNWRGKVFNLSGFTDEEREQAAHLFPIGSIVTFRYRELSDDGVPKEARFWRKYEPS